jgi:hypothetical protein
MTRDPIETAFAQQKHDAHCLARIRHTAESGGRKRIESIACDIPPELLNADSILTGYGRWAVTSSRGGRPATLDREFRPEMDKRESYAHWVERCQQGPRDVLMPTPVAMLVQRVLASLPDRERIVLAALYVPRRIPATVQLQILHITPQHSRALHLSGLRRFDTLHRAAVMKG